MNQSNNLKSGELSAPVQPPAINIAGLQSVTDFGFVGGRNSLKDFCRNVFSKDEPRFLKNAAGDLVVFRYADLTALGATAAVANVPPAGWYPDLTLEEATGDLPPEGQRPPRLAVSSILANQFFTMNPPIHTPVRKILANQLGPKQLTQMEGLARETISGLINELPRGESFDFVSEFCEKLTARFFGTLIGMTDEEKIAIVESVREMTPLFFLDPTPEDQDQLDVGAGHWRELMERATLRTLRSGKSEMITGMAENLAKIKVEEENVETIGIVPRNIGAFMAGNMIDAFHTIALGVCNTMYTLLHHPDGFNQIRENPALLPRAVNEALRMESPAIFFRRQAIEDVEYDGMLIPRGTYVAMFWSAGNQDPTVFPNPEQFDLNRGNAGTTTFGGGLHICPGRHVTAMLIRMVLEALNEHRIKLAMVGNADDWIEGHFMSQLKSMTVRAYDDPHHVS